MHYFKMNIGDYAKKAGRLSMLEHGAYTLLIHSCYDRERFPTLEDAIDWCWARSDEEKAAVEFVLSKFFDLIDGVYVQNRIQEEIDKYHENALTNKRIATEREGKRRSNTRSVHEACESVNEPPPNQEPLTINQEPLTNKPINLVLKENIKENPDSIRINLPEVTDQTFTDFLKLRKAKKSPLTIRAIENIRSEASKAGISLETALIEYCARGWVGFKAEWYQKAQAPPTYQTKQQLASVAARSIFGNEAQEKVINCEVIEHGSIAKQLG